MNQELVQNVKDWIVIDNEMKEMRKKMKEYRKQKKALTENLVNVMKSNEIDCFDIQNGQLIYTKQSEAPLARNICLDLLQRISKMIRIW